MQTRKAKILTDACEALGIKGVVVLTTAFGQKQTEEHCRVVVDWHMLVTMRDFPGLLVSDEHEHPLQGGMYIATIKAPPSTKRKPKAKAKAKTKAKAKGV